MASAFRGDTASRILDVAERLVQVQGFNGFSYADIASELNIRKASLHHHFPTKEVLGMALVARYQKNFLTALEQIEAATNDASVRLKSYARLYTTVLRKDRMCLCGMLAADFETLPNPMRQAVTDFFTANEAWLTRILDEGRRTDSLRFDGRPAAMAALLVSSLEGAMLLARSYGQVSRFESVVKKLLDGVTSVPRVPR